VFGQNIVLQTRPQVAGLKKSYVGLSQPFWMIFLQLNILIFSLTPGVIQVVVNVNFTVCLKTLSRATTRIHSITSTYCRQLKARRSSETGLQPKPATAWQTLPLSGHDEETQGALAGEMKLHHCYVTMTIV